VIRRTVNIKRTIRILDMGCHGCLLEICDVSQLGREKRPDSTRAIPRLATAMPRVISTCQCVATSVAVDIVAGGQGSNPLLCQPRAGAIRCQARPDRLTSCRNFVACPIHPSIGARGSGQQEQTFSPHSHPKTLRTARRRPQTTIKMTSLRCVNPPTTASLFIQLSMRRQTVTSALPILDLLLPLRASCRTHHSTAIAAAQAAARSRATVVAPFIESPRKAFQLPAARFPLRSFSTTRMRRATHAIFNPQHDDDGNEMTLEITQRAAKVCLRPRYPLSCSLCGRKNDR